MKFVIVLCLFGVYSIDTQASIVATHWMVTESGLIQPKIDSPFEMARPYDLLAFLNQDTRWDNIKTMYNDLSRRQTKINKMWSDLETLSNMAVQTTHDRNCMKAGALHRIDWYMTHLEDGKSKNIPEKEYKLSIPTRGQDLDVPDCKKISSLTFSSSAFEQLTSMRERENLTAIAEVRLPDRLSPIMTVDQFGHWVAAILRQNTSSWLHYNLASIYWRVRGNAPKAVECSRRAVHHSSRLFRDVPLLGLGTILYRSKHFADAAVVLQQAVDHDPTFVISQFLLANAYAMIGDFNKSIIHYDKCVSQTQQYDIPKQYKYAALCTQFLLKNLNTFYRDLQKFKEELNEYSLRETHWLKSQAAFMRTMKHKEEFDYRNVERNCEKLSDIMGLNLNEVKKEGDKNSLIMYFLKGPQFKEQWFQEKGVLAIDAAYSLQRLMKHIDSQTSVASEFVVQTNPLNKISDGIIVKEIGPMPVFPDIQIGKLNIVNTKSNAHLHSDKKARDGTLSEYEIGTSLYPLNMKVNRNFEDFDTDPTWPSIAFCREEAHRFLPNVEAIFPIFLPFENKGVSLRSLLSDKIGVPAGVEHDLPWHPPSCPPDRDAAGYTQKRNKQQPIIGDIMNTDFLRRKLLEYVYDGDDDSERTMQDTEIGQRIYAAMKLEIAPKWLIFTLSSLYWRVRGNNINALNCLHTAKRTVKNRYKDIVMTSLASVYLEMGYFDEALNAAEEAFRVNLYEPATNFVLAELNMIKKHRNTHMFHLKQVVRIDPNFMGGVARNLLNSWACILRQVDTVQEIKIAENEVCFQVEPGMSMVCERDGTNCQVNNDQCNSKAEKDKSAILRMLELKDDSLEDIPDYLDESAFDVFMERMPKDPGDMSGHTINYQAMMNKIELALKGCGSKECSKIQAEDLELKEEECAHQYLQIGFWLSAVSFRQLFSESDNKLVAEISTTADSNKKTPECQLVTDTSEDFFLDRISSVDVEGWQPDVSLMHQITEMFKYFDFMTLGAKLTKYVELKPNSWLGALAGAWWCGAGGRGVCAVNCFTAAYSFAPAHNKQHAVRAMAAMLNIQSKYLQAKEIAYLSLYMTPKSSVDAFLVAITHTYLAEYDSAVWMYRYALTSDQSHLPTKACLHATMCLMLFEDTAKDNKVEK